MTSSAAKDSLKSEFFERLKNDGVIFQFIQDCSIGSLSYWDLSNPDCEWVNSDFWQSLGYSPERVPATSSWQHLDERQDLAAVIKGFQERFTNSDQAVYYDLQYKHKNGSTVLIRRKCITVRDSKGTAIRVLGVPADGNRHQKSAEVQSVIARYESILNTQSTFIIRTDLNGNYTYANDHFCKVFQTRPSDLIGASSMASIIPDDHGVCYDAVMKCVSTPGKPVRAVLHKPVPQGGIIVTSWEFVCILNDKGDSSEIQCVGIDITDRIEYERKIEEKRLELESFSDATRDLLCIADLDGYVVKANRSWEAVLGYSGNSLIGKRLLDIVHPEDLQATLGVMADLQAGNEVLDFTNRCRHLDGSYKLIEWRFVVNGYNLYASARDITARVKQTVLIKERSLLSSFYQNSPLMMGIVEVFDGDILHIRDNKKSQEFFRKTQREMQNAFASSLGVPDNIIKTWIDHYHLCERQGRPSHFEYMYESADTTTYLAATTFFIGSTPMGRKRYAYIVDDITARKTAEGELRKKEIQYQQLVQTLPVGVFEMEILPDGRSNYKYVSPKWTEITGLTLEELKADPGMTLQSLHPDDADSFFKVAQDAAKFRGPIYWEGRKIINGVTKYILIQSTIQFSDDGYIAVNGIEADISARKEAEAGLQRTKAELEKKTYELDVTLDGAGVGLWEYDARSGAISWDKYLRKMFQVDKEELTYEDWSNLVHPNDLPATENAFMEFLKNGRHYDIEYRIVLKDGEIRHHNSKGIRFLDADGDVIKVSGISVDITLRKEVEYQLSLVSSVLSQTSSLARVGGCVLDIEKGQMYFTDVLKEIIGLPPDYQPTLDSYLECCEEGDSRDRMIAVMDRAVNSGEGWDEELRLITAQGTALWVRIIGKSEFKDGRCIRLFGAVQDIEDRKRAEERIVASQKVAEAANKAKSEFLSSMSHEIRTPLNGVIGFADLLIRTELDSSQQEYMSALHRSANSLLDIINDILDFSKIEAGKLELNLEKIDVLQLTSQVIDIIKFLAHKKGLEVLVNLDDDVPRYIWADAIRLRQILVNLLNNAVKFTERGEIELRITVSEETDELADEQRVVRFLVRDTGIGIEPKAQLKIFDAFSQEDNTTAKKFGGTGLGLAISNKLLALMNSELNLESVVSKGSSFFFDLLLKTEHGPAETFEDLAAINSVLIIDDNDNNRFLLRKMFPDKEVTEAKHGIEALTLLETGAIFDAIIMDYHMPWMDGIETARKIRQAPFGNVPEPIILLYTSVDDAHIKTACNDLGIKHCLVKPIRKDQLFQALSTSKKVADVVKPEVPRQMLAPLTVLVVDDHDSNLMLAKSMIRKIDSSITVLEARDGREAIRMYGIHKPDITFMDIQMPVLSGYEATRQIRSTAGGSDAIIIALTAGTVKGEREKCLEIGMNDYLSKPFVKDSLEKLLIKWQRKEEPAAGYMEDPKHFISSRLERNLDNDLETVQEVIKIATEEFCKAMNLLRNCDAKETDRLKKIGHKLRGSANNLCCYTLAGLAGKLEAINDADSSALTDILLDIENEYLFLGKLFSEYLMSIQPPNDLGRSELLSAGPARDNP